MVEMSKNECLVNRIESVSLLAKKIYGIYISLCIYSAITVLTTNDYQLIINDKVELPIISTEIQVAGFFFITPILLIALYLYMHLYLYYNDKMIIRLKNYNDDDLLVNYYPWFININRFVEKGFVGHVHRFFVNVILWWSLPLVLSIFAIVYIKKHEAFMSYFMGILPVIGTLISLYFWGKYDNNSRKDGKYRYFYVILSYGRLSMIALIGIYISVYFIYLIPAINTGEVHRALKKIAFVELENVVLESGKKKSIFKNINLNGSTLTDVTIRNSDIRNVSFVNAKIYDCDFRGSYFSFANFKGSYLSKSIFDSTKFTDSIFDSAKATYYFERNDTTYYDLIGMYSPSEENDNSFKESKLYSSSFDDALFVGVDFTGAEIFGADISETRFVKCDFSKSYFTDFRGTPYINLNIKDSYFRNCIFDSAAIQSFFPEGVTINDSRFILSSFKNANIYNISFNNSVLAGNNLLNTTFNECRFKDSQFWDADTLFDRLVEDSIMISFISLNKKHFSKRGVNFIDKGLEQLKDVKTFKGSIMDKKLYDKIEKKYPHLIYGYEKK